MHLRRTVPLVLTFFGAACALPSPPPPAAEFLVSSSDATYWVQSSRRGFHIRRSPLILARTGGKYYELFVEELDRSYANALFTGERIFRRDIDTGDSAVIFEDTAVIRRASAFHRDHPEVPSLDSRDEDQEDADYSVSGETDILNVLGPYVALEHRLAVDRGTVSSEDTSRAVIDLRSGATAGIAQIAADPLAREASGFAKDHERRWHNAVYDVVAHIDLSAGTQSVLLDDRHGRQWRLGVLKSPYIQIFWLDSPKIDTRSRRALIRAFNEATSYGEPIQLVIHEWRPHPRPYAPPIS